MSDELRSLTDDEVRQICLIIESLERSTFDFLQVEFGGIKLTLSKGQPPAAVIAASQVLPVPSVAVPESSTNLATASTVAPTVSVDKAGVKKDDEAGGVEIVAPLLGRFYAQSEPGALPFVSIGSEVTEDTTVGLIEVMKTFNAVRAGIRGIITQICVQDAQLVEYGELLFRVRPQ